MFNIRILYFLLLLINLTGFAFASITDYYYLLKIDSQSTYPSQIYPGSIVSVNLTLLNISQSLDATNITISFGPNSQYFTYIKNEDILDVIKFNQYGTTSLQLRVNPDTPGGYYTIPLKINYFNKANQITMDTHITLNVLSYDKINVIINEYPRGKQYLDDIILIKGEVKNEGNSTLKGISIKSDFGLNKLIPLQQINQFVGDLQPKQSIPFEFKFEIPRSANPDAYDINIIATDIINNYDYEKILFIVEDKPTLIIADSEISIDTPISGKDSVLSQGDLFSLSIQLENISKSKAKSVAINLIDIDDYLEGTSISYLGSIDSDDTSSGIFDLRVLNNADVGEKLITANIIYIDEYNQEYNIIQQIPIFINKKPMSFSAIFYLILLAGIGYGIYYLYKRRLKTNKLIGLK